jgi:hypothetical protein
MALASSKLNEKHFFRRSAVLQLRFNVLTAVMTEVRKSSQPLQSLAATNL